MILGFSGASEGMTLKQRATVTNLFMDLSLTELHHGDCIGADSQVHIDTYLLGIKIFIHPPTDSKARAFCSGINVTIFQREPYLKRNWAIARAGIDGLIAAPPNYVEILRGNGGGTWSTIRYARKLKRRIWIVFPDGTFRQED